MIKPLVEHVVKELVDVPEVVHASVIHDGDKIAVEVVVAADDFKRVIGKEGCIIKSLRSLLMAAQNNKEVRLEVIKQ